MSVLAEIAKDPARAVLVVTHDPRIVPFADRIVRIEDGLIVGEENGMGHKKDIPAHEACRHDGRAKTQADGTCRPALRPCRCFASARRAQEPLARKATPTARTGRRWRRAGSNPGRARSGSRRR